MPRVLVVGSGPIGLEAAVLCAQSGFDVLLVERGATLAASVRDWSHVQLFSSNELNCSEWGLRACRELGGGEPQSGDQPTGAELVGGYLERLGAWLAALPAGRYEVRLATSVDAVSRGSILKGEEVKGAGEHARDATPFAALLSCGETEERVDGLAAVLDCSGTYGNPNFLGRGGAPALGERPLRSSAEALRKGVPGSFSLPASRFFFRGLPDALGAHRGAFVVHAKGGGGAPARLRSVALVGGGYSAATVLLQLRALATEFPQLNVEVDWLLRREAAAEPYATIENDPLPTRATLVGMANAVARGEGCPPNMAVRVHRGCAVDELAVTPPANGSAAEALVGGLLRLRGTCEGGAALDVSAEVLISLVGFRPNLDLTRELQVHHCYASEGPMKLAASLLAARVAAKGSSAGGDCLKQAKAGPELLVTPEPRFYVLGSKAYGRASSFLLKHGHEHVKAVVDMLKADLM